MTGRWRFTLILLASLGSFLGPLAEGVALGQDISVLASYLTGGQTDVTAEALSELASPRKLVRRDFDLTGDGVPEVFLSDDLMWSQGEGWLWQVYDVSDPAQIQHLGSVRFHENHVRVTAPGELRALYRGTSAGEALLVDYQWTGSEIVEVHRTLLEDGPELTAEELEIKRFQEQLPEWAPWAEVTSQGLGPWIDPSTDKPVRGLAPIVTQRFAISAAKRVGPPSLLDDLGNRLVCPQQHCELYVDLADLTGDGEPELIFNSSNDTRKPRPVYAEVAEGYRYLGNLPTGVWRLDDQGRVSVVESAPPALVRYRVTSEGMTLLEELTLPAGRSEIGRERQAIAEQLSGRDLYAEYFRIPWKEAADKPASPPWLTFKTREPADIDVDLSLPVLNPKTGDQS